ncbi:MAG: ABC transporter ATP-binding protein [Acidobacteriota bacterium]|nr:ABC transporter ATP-binding protein [Acidobacteriota bacterium]
MENGNAIRVDCVTKRYGPVTAVDAVSLQIERGEFFTLLGPSGSGKTTLIRLIAGFDLPDTGRIYLGPRDVTNEPPYRRPVHTVFQHYALFPHLNVFKNVAFGLEQKRLPKPDIERKVAQALELVQLAGYQQRMPDELSGGQQQRVALARAIVLEPQALLLDEPLAALDFKLRKQMQQELKQLQRQLNMSFLLVTHDQEEAISLSDRIAVMADGRVQQIGTPRAVYERPQTTFVANFIGVCNIFEAEIVARNGQRVLLNIEGQPMEIALNGESLIGPRVRFAVRPEKIELSAEPLRADGSIWLRGVVENKSYLGDLTHWQVRVGRLLVTVSEQNHSGWRSERFHHGQSVFLAWMPESVILLSD